MRLEKKVIVVTGATSGIGKGIVKILLKEGAVVVYAGRNRERGHKLEEELKSQGYECLFIPTDVRVVNECGYLIDETVKRYGRIDGLVNDAGIFPYYNFENTTEEVFQNTMDTNVKGAFFCTQKAVGYMKEQGGGSVVNIGSTHWQVGGQELSAYAVSKGALHTLTEHIAHHFSPYGIRCNWVTVGWVLSEGEKRRCMEAGMTEEEIQLQAGKEIPAGRFQTAEDIAYACVFLLSDEAKQVIGTDINVTGGFRSVGRVG
jgi:NAD(P)-dependent dehydrogenase (short-subunit alcohol dehydrogenase family)